MFVIGLILVLFLGYSPVKESNAFAPQLFAYPYYSPFGVVNGISNYRNTDLSSAKICLYYGINKNEKCKNECHTILKAKELFKSPYFVTSNKQKTVLFIHGYSESSEDPTTQEIVNAYLQSNRDYNILVLDWGELASGNYALESVRNAEHLSHLVADMLIVFFMEKYFEIDNFHIIGHSLGAQLAGMIGRSFISKTHKGLKLKRITGLDPSFPLFYPPVYQYISHKDADFVDIIHTDAWIYGAPRSSGTVDFWPNRGTGLQPGCPSRDYKPLSDIDLCSHRRAWVYYVESVRNAFSFAAIKCHSWLKFQVNFCSTAAKTYMGIDVDFSARGDFFLQTNSEHPFSKGLAGTVYEKTGYFL